LIDHLSRDLGQVRSTRHDIVLHRRAATTPGVDIPFGIDNADPVFTFTFTYGFGRQ
jgi:hypothetical protein